MCLCYCAAKSLQSCPTLCDPSPRGSPIPGFLQARTLEWVAISFSNAWKWKSESEVAQSCPTLSDPVDWSLPDFSIHGIFQVRVLEWGAIAFSGMCLYWRTNEQCFIGFFEYPNFIIYIYIYIYIIYRSYILCYIYSHICICRNINHMNHLWTTYMCIIYSLSSVQLFLWPHGPYPARLLYPWGFLRQEYWSGLPFPSPGELPNPGIKPRSPASQTDSLSLSHWGNHIYI